MLDDRGRLRFEGLHAVGKDGVGVVGALNKCGTIYITDAGDSGRIRVDVVDAACGRDSAAGDAVLELFVVDDDADGDDRENIGRGG